MKRLAVIGHPVAHSRSPAMQTAALEALGLAGEWSYEAIDLTPDQFAEEVRALPADGFVGVNVTIPHKEAALELASEATERGDRDRRRQHAQLRGRRDSRRQHGCPRV